MYSNYNDVVQMHNNVNIVHTVAPLTAHPAPIYCQPPPHINNVSYYTTVRTQKPDIADDAIVC